MEQQHFQRSRRLRARRFGGESCPPLPASVGLPIIVSCGMKPSWLSVVLLPVMRCGSGRPLHGVEKGKTSQIWQETRDEMMKRRDITGQRDVRRTSINAVTRKGSSWLVFTPPPPLGEPGKGFCEIIVAHFFQILWKTTYFLFLL